MVFRCKKNHFSTGMVGSSKSGYETLKWSNRTFDIHIALAKAIA